MRQVTIHAKAGDYPAFPSLQLSTSGDLYVIFRNAPDDHEEGHIHIDVRSTAVLKRSSDGGETWTAVGKPIAGHLPRSGMQDPSIAILSDGSFLLTYFHWRHSPDSPGARMGAIVEGVWVRRSQDEGLTWDAPTHVPFSPTVEMGISEPAIELSDGTLLMAGYASIGEGGHAALLSRSTDGGTTWSAPVAFAHDLTGTVDFQEPALLSLGDGHILCVMRAVDRTVEVGEADEKQRQRLWTAWMYQTHSWDNGETWEPSQRTPMYGHPPNLLQLKDGRVLCTYGYRRAPFGVRACLSRDGGRTWDIEGEIVLRDDGGGGDLGYPSSVQLADGAILSAYYIHTATDTTRHIEATRWHPD